MKWGLLVGLIILLIGGIFFKERAALREKIIPILKSINDSENFAADILPAFLVAE